MDTLVILTTFFFPLFRGSDRCNGPVSTAGALGGGRGGRNFTLGGRAPLQLCSEIGSCRFVVGSRHAELSHLVGFLTGVDNWGGGGRQGLGREKGVRKASWRTIKECSEGEEREESKLENIASCRVYFSVLLLGGPI